MTRMTPGSWTRRVGFWTLDAIRGRRVRRHYQDVRALMSAGDPAPGDVLERLLEHASRTTPFYQAYAGRSLEAYPVVDKSTVKADGQNFRSSMFEGESLHERRTSGSTGTPFFVVQDARKRRRMIAEAIYFNERSGQRLGDRLMWLFAARLVPVSRWQRISQNIIPVDHVGLDDAAKERIVETLRRDHVNAILSIPATHLSLARFIEARGIASDGFGLSVVLSTGENLDPTMKRRLESAFGCPVVDRYGNEENGFLACSVPGEDGLRLNRANYLFEFLKPESDEPQPSGDLARVVITDLYNYAMPFIRYDTGDLAIVADHGTEGPTTLVSVEGRRIDVIYDTSGGQITSPSVSGVMSRGFPDLEGYQLIQDGASSYRLRVALGSKAYGEPELVAVLRKWLGTDAQITVSFEPRIASLASGKHRPVLCEYSPDD